MHSIGRSSYVATFIKISPAIPEPIKGVSEFLLTAFADAGPAVGKTGISSVGSIISIRKCVDAVIQLSEVEFQLLSSMAAAGKATSVYVCFQEPRYGSALIKSCSVSSRSPEDEWSWANQPR
jgi:hypothetical protein